MSNPTPWYLQQSFPFPAFSSVQRNAAITGPLASMAGEVGLPFSVSTQPDYMASFQRDTAQAFGELPSGILPQPAVNQLFAGQPPPADEYSPTEGLTNADRTIQETKHRWPGEFRGVRRIDNGELLFSTFTTASPTGELAMVPIYQANALKTGHYWHQEEVVLSLSAVNHLLWSEPGVYHTPELIMKTFALLGVNMDGSGTNARNASNYGGEFKCAVVNAGRVQMNNYYSEFQRYLVPGVTLQLALTRLRRSDFTTGAIGKYNPAKAAAAAAAAAAAPASPSSASASAAPSPRVSVGGKRSAASAADAKYADEPVNLRSKRGRPTDDTSAYLVYEDGIGNGLAALQDLNEQAPYVFQFLPVVKSGKTRYGGSRLWTCIAEGWNELTVNVGVLEGVEHSGMTTALALADPTTLPSSRKQRTYVSMKGSTDWVNSQGDAPILTINVRR